MKKTLDFLVVFFILCLGNITKQIAYTPTVHAYDESLLTSCKCHSWKRLRLITALKIVGLI